MGVFNITPRSKQLGNIQGGSVRRVNVPNYHIGSGSTEMWRAAGRLGRDIMSAGKDMAYIAGDMRREQRMIQDAETETAFVDAMRSKMEDPANGLLGRVRTAGNSEALQGCVTEGQDYFRTAAEELLKDKGYSGDRKQKMLMRLKEAASPFQRAMAHGVLAKTNELKVSAADRNFNTLLETWKSNMTDEDATRAAIDSYRASQRARGLSDDTVEINTDKILRGMASDFALLQFGTLPTEKAVDDQIEVLNKNEKSIISGNAILSQYFANRNIFDPELKKSLERSLEMRRREIHERDSRKVETAANSGIAALCSERFDDVKNADGTVTPGVESSILSLRQLAETMPEGSDARANAARMAADIDEKADVVASRQIENDLIAGKKLTLDDGKTTVFAPGSRKSRLYHAVLEKFNAETSKKDHATNDRELRYAEAALDYMIESGAYTDDQVAGVKTAIYEKAKALMEGRRISPQDHASFVSRWRSREKEDTSKAAVEFDRAFGVSFDVQPDGDVTTAVVNAARKDPHFKPMFPGTDEDVAADEYFRMRQAFLDNLNALDQKADRVQEARRLIGEFKSGWYAKQSEANIEALSRTMTEIHNAATAEREEQRLREEEEARKKNIPIVSTEHPANRPQEDPLDFYRKAVDPYGITPNYSDYMK